MRYRTLGRTGLLVSEVSLGTVEIGLDYGIDAGGRARRPAASDAARLLNRALDLGVNLIDTARGYGEAEAIIGQALEGRRKEFVLCSKVLPRENENLPPAELREKLRESVHTSLRLLRTSELDILMIHSPPAQVIVRGEVAAILEELRGEGKVRWVGASLYGEQAATEALRSGRYDCLQVAYSALDRRLEKEVLPAGESQGIGVVARSVLLKGILTPRYHHLPESLARLREAAAGLDALANANGMSLPELAYRFVLSHSIPQTALVGASSVEELEAAVRFAEAGPASAELAARISGFAITDEQLLNPGTWGIG
ncbi:MAG: aldo/keto reductase [Acidobacteria bacterium]|nr:aldo/keto reductase [Acidobacteriota bacterium]